MHAEESGFELEGAESSELVFVYGTLRMGGSNHFRMEGAELVGPAAVRGRLYRIDWYPGLVLDPEGPTVAGEVFRVPAKLLARLDEFEGAAGKTEDEFRRVKVAVCLNAGGSGQVWVYEYRGAVKLQSEIFPGDWLAQSHGQVRSVFSLLTFGLMPLTFGFNGLVFADMIRVPATGWWVHDMLRFAAAGALLTPVGTAWLGRKRKEGLANGAEACAVVALCFFSLLVILAFMGRY